MKNGLIIILILISNYLPHIACQMHNSGSFSHFSTELQTTIKTIVKAVLNSKPDSNTEKDIIPISEKCKSSIESAYLDQTQKFYMEKLINDSSYNKNDIGSFLPCMKRKPIDPDNEKLTWNYLIATFNHITDLKEEGNTIKQDTQKGTNEDPKPEDKPIEAVNITINTSLYETQWKIYGMCIAPGCNEAEYSTLMYFLDKHLDHFFQIHNISEVSTIVVESNNLGYTFELLDLLRFLPCLLIFVQLFMSMFGCFPYVLCKRCFKNKNPSSMNMNPNGSVYNHNQSHNGSVYDASNNESILKRSSDSIFENRNFNKKDYLKFTTTFSLSRNSEELFGTGDGTSNLHNDSGMTYLKGIIGINMIFLSFGAVFFILHLSFVSKINEIIFINFMRNFFFGIFFYGMRYAPIMLFSCSGFSLVYKQLCYLDECSLDVKEKQAADNEEEGIDQEEIKHKGKDKDKDKNRNHAINRQSVPDEDDDDEEEEEEREYNDIYFTNLLCFWKRQCHKYVLVILVMLFFKFSLYKLLLLFVNKGPMWEVFKRKVIDSPYSFDWPLIVSFVFGVHSFYLPEDCLDYFLNYQWMIYNEIIFFMISSFFIYVGYRYKIRVDIFFLSAMCAILIMKLIVVFISSQYHSSLYYFLFKYWNIVSIPFFNYFYHVIGLMFGAANYVIQKDISYKTAQKEEKYFLIPVIKVLNILKKKGAVFIYSIGAVVAIIIIGLSILQAIILQFSSVEELLANHLEFFLSNIIKNTFWLLDTYIVVFLFHFSTFCFYLIGNNAINNFFSLKGWGILSKMYFSFILLVHLVILYFVYQSETPMSFDISNTILYSLICTVFSLLVSCLFYISFELPYKRIIKMILKLTDEDDNEEKGGKKQQFGLEVLEESQDLIRPSI